MRKRARTLKELNTLRMAGTDGEPMKESAPEPPRRKCFRDFMVEEAQWLAQDVHGDRLWKVAAAKRCAEAAVVVGRRVLQRQRKRLYRTLTSLASVDALGAMSAADSAVLLAQAQALACARPPQRLAARRSQPSQAESVQQAAPRVSWRQHQETRVFAQLPEPNSGLAKWARRAATARGHAPSSAQSDSSSASVSSVSSDSDSDEERGKVQTLQLAAASSLALQHVQRAADVARSIKRTLLGAKFVMPAPAPRAGGPARDGSIKSDSTVISLPGLPRGLKPAELALCVRQLVLHLRAQVLADSLATALRPYQLAGLAWLLSNWAVGYGAILGDERGLGKRPVAAAAIHALLHACRGSDAGISDSAALLRFPPLPALHEPSTPGSVLVVAPAILLPHWRAELARWCPTLTIGHDLLCAEAGRPDIVLVPPAAVKAAPWTFQHVQVKLDTASSAASSAVKSAMPVCEEAWARGWQAVVVDATLPPVQPKHSTFQAFGRAVPDPEDSESGSPSASPSESGSPLVAPDYVPRPATCMPWRLLSKLPPSRRLVLRNRALPEGAELQHMAKFMHPLHLLYQTCGLAALDAKESAAAEALLLKQADQAGVGSALRATVLQSFEALVRSGGALVPFTLQRSLSDQDVLVQLPRLRTQSVYTPLTSTQTSICRRRGVTTAVGEAFQLAKAMPADVLPLMRFMVAAHAVSQSASLSPASVAMLHHAVRSYKMDGSQRLPGLVSAAQREAVAARSRPEPEPLSEDQAAARFNSAHAAATLARGSLLGSSALGLDSSWGGLSASLLDRVLVSRCAVVDTSFTKRRGKAKQRDKGSVRSDAVVRDGIGWALQAAAYHTHGGALLGRRTCSDAGAVQHALGDLLRARADEQGPLLAPARVAVVPPALQQYASGPVAELWAGPPDGAMLPDTQLEAGSPALALSAHTVSAAPVRWRPAPDLQGLAAGSLPAVCCPSYTHEVFTALPALFVPTALRAMVLSRTLDWVVLPSSSSAFPALQATSYTVRSKSVCSPRASCKLQYLLALCTEALLTGDRLLVLTTTPGMADLVHGGLTAHGVAAICLDSASMAGAWDPEAVDNFNAVARFRVAIATVTAGAPTSAVWQGLRTSANVACAGDVLPVLNSPMPCGATAAVLLDTPLAASAGTALRLVIDRLAAAGISRVLSLVALGTLEVSLVMAAGGLGSQDTSEVASKLYNHPWIVGGQLALPSSDAAAGRHVRELSSSASHDNRTTDVASSVGTAEVLGGRGGVLSHGVVGYTQGLRPGLLRLADAVGMMAGVVRSTSKNRAQCRQLSDSVNDAMLQAAMLQAAYELQAASCSSVVRGSHGVLYNDVMFPGTQLSLQRADAWAHQFCATLAGTGGQAALHQFPGRLPGALAALRPGAAAAATAASRAPFRLGPGKLALPLTYKVAPLTAGAVATGSLLAAGPMTVAAAAIDEMARLQDMGALHVSSVFGPPHPERRARLASAAPQGDAAVASAMRVRYDVSNRDGFASVAQHPARQMALRPVDTAVGGAGLPVSMQETANRNPASLRPAMISNHADLTVRCGSRLRWSALPNSINWLDYFSPAPIALPTDWLLTALRRRMESMAPACAAPAGNELSLHGRLSVLPMMKRRLVEGLPAPALAHISAVAKFISDEAKKARIKGSLVMLPFPACAGAPRGSYSGILASGRQLALAPRNNASAHMGELVHGTPTALAIRGDATAVTAEAAAKRCIIGVRGSAAALSPIVVLPAAHPWTRAADAALLQAVSMWGTQWEFLRGLLSPDRLLRDLPDSAPASYAHSLPPYYNALRGERAQPHPRSTRMLYERHRHLVLNGTLEERARLLARVQRHYTTGPLVGTAYNGLAGQLRAGMKRGREIDVSPAPGAEPRAERASAPSVLAGPLWTEPATCFARTTLLEAGLEPMQRKVAAAPRAQVCATARHMQLAAEKRNSDSSMQIDPSSITVDQSFVQVREQFQLRVNADTATPLEMSIAVRDAVQSKAIPDVKRDTSWIRQSGPYRLHQQAMRQLQRSEQRAMPSTAAAASSAPGGTSSSSTPRAGSGPATGSSGQKAAAAAAAAAAAGVGAAVASAPAPAPAVAPALAPNLPGPSGKSATSKLAPPLPPLPPPAAAVAAAGASTPAPAPMLPPTPSAPSLPPTPAASSTPAPPGRAASSGTTAQAGRKRKRSKSATPKPASPAAPPAPAAPAAPSDADAAGASSMDQQLSSMSEASREAVAAVLARQDLTDEEKVEQVAQIMMQDDMHAR